MMDQEILLLDLCHLPSVILGMAVGQAMFRRIPRRWFIRGLLTMLTILGLKLCSVKKFRRSTSCPLRNLPPLHRSTIDFIRRSGFPFSPAYVMILYNLKLHRNVVSGYTLHSIDRRHGILTH